MQPDYLLSLFFLVYIDDDGNSPLLSPLKQIAPDCMSCSSTCCDDCCTRKDGKRPGFPSDTGLPLIATIAVLGETAKDGGLPNDTGLPE